MITFCILVIAMTWFKVDDSSPDHPKLKALTDKAFRWWFNGLAYASRYLTNGRLPKVFWKEVPKGARHELSSNRLWDWDDPDFVIHDYLTHQSSREDVEAEKQRNREKVAAFRERRKAERRTAVTDGNRSVTGNSVTTGNRLVTDPENREQRTDTENREQRTPTASRGPALILSPRDHMRLMDTHAFVGSKLRVPKVLHAELVAKSGANADAELDAWYLRLNEELELSGEGTGDVFAWLRPRHQAFAIEKGWVRPAPKPIPLAKPRPRGVAELLAEEAARKAGRVS